MLLIPTATHAPLVAVLFVLSTGKYADLAKLPNCTVASVPETVKASDVVILATTSRCIPTSSSAFDLLPTCSSPCVSCTSTASCPNLPWYLP